MSKLVNNFLKKLGNCSIWLWTCPCLATYTVHRLFNFLTCVPIYQNVFVSFFNFLLLFNGEMKMINDKLRMIYTPFPHCVKTQHKNGPRQVTTAS